MQQIHKVIFLCLPESILAHVGVTDTMLAINEVNSTKWWLVRRTEETRKYVMDKALANVQHSWTSSAASSVCDKVYINLDTKGCQLCNLQSPTDTAMLRNQKLMSN